MLVEEIEGQRPAYFRVESWRAIVEREGSRGTEATAEATVKLHAGGERIVTVGEGNGPANALDHALREALLRVYPEMEKFELIDFKVRILEETLGTDAVTRVLVETTDGQDTWSTVGVGPNILEASWEAVTDAAIYGLRHLGIEPR
jgi:2-isopropylmalate synthase